MYLIKEDNYGKKELLEKLQLEKQELEQKRNKLNTFITSEEFFKLDKINRLLLMDQLQIMECYITILNERIAINESDGMEKDCDFKYTIIGRYLVKRVKDKEC